MDAAAPAMGAAAPAAARAATVQLRLLSDPGEGGGGGSLLLRLPGRRAGAAGRGILFNASEGVVRACGEHGIKTAGVDTVFFTRVCAGAIGGLASLCFAQSDGGAAELEVFGLAGTDAYVHSLRHIFRRRYPELRTQQFGGAPGERYRDEELVVVPAIVGGGGGGGDGGEPAAAQPAAAQPSLPRRPEFLQHCPLPGQASAKGESALVSSGSQRPAKRPRPAAGAPTGASAPPGCACYVVYPTCAPRLAIVVLDVPSLEHAARAMQAPALARLAHRAAADEDDAAACLVVHLHVHSAVQASEAWATWLGSFGESARHVYACSAAPALRRSAEMKAKLNVLDPRSYELPKWSAATRGEADVGDGSALRVPVFAAVSVCTECGNGDAAPGLCVNVSTDGAHAARELDREELEAEVRYTLDIEDDERAGQLGLWPRLSLAPTLSGRSQEVPYLWSLRFHGTGCAKASCLRGSAALSLRAAGGRVLLLDCGEMAASAMPAMIREAVDVVFISHAHADHCGGIQAVLAAARARGSGRPPVCVVGPRAVGTMLAEYSAAVQPLPYVFYHFSEWPITSAPVHSGAPRTRQAREALRLLGVNSMQSVPVDHCPDAHALVLQAATLKLVYSGDCRPSRRLVELGRGATIAVHEATFATEDAAHATRKRHSTLAEAAAAISAMSAGLGVLTHFSQKLPPVPFGAMPLPDRVCCAFDGMVVTAENFERLPAVGAFAVSAIGQADAADAAAD